MGTHGASDTNLPVLSEYKNLVQVNKIMTWNLLVVKSITGPVTLADKDLPVKWEGKQRTSTTGTSLSFRPVNRKEGTVRTLGGHDRHERPLTGGVLGLYLTGPGQSLIL